MVLLSLAMSLSVYLCVITMLDSQAARTIVSNNMDTDLVIQNDTGTKEKAKDRKDIFSSALVKSIRSRKDVAEMHAVLFSEITIPWEPDFMESWMKEFYEKWMSIPYEKERKEYREHPENFGTSLLGIDEQEFDRLNQTFETPISKKEAFILKAGICYKKEYDRGTEKAVLSLLKKDANARDFSWESKIEEADEMRKAQGNMPQIGMGIVLILAFIGIMNYMNTFVVNVQSRMTELSVMESVGMTDRQLMGMLVREGALYAGGAWGLTLTAGMGIVYLIYQTMNYRGVSFLVPVVPLLLTAAISFVVCIAIPVVTWKVLERQGTVVERIKGVE